MRTWVLGSLATLLAASLAVAASYQRGISAARERLLGRSSVVRSPYGDIEFAQGGSGPGVLVVHGAGGGFDQGELIARAVLGDAVRWIAPSRFGYLRSTFDEGAPAEDQAHAFSFLLDRLGLERVAVVAVSAGGSSALDLALLYPERVTSLTLLSCATTPVAAPEQAQADRKGELLVRAFESDFLYWGATRLFKRRFMTLMGADASVIAALSVAQRQWIDDFIEQMSPVSLRYAGVVLDNARRAPGERIAAIRAPTLVVHAEDDTLQLFKHAAFASATIPGARLLRFDRGGHFVVIVQQAVVRAAVRHHVLRHARAGAPDDHEHEQQRVLTP